MVAGSGIEDMPSPAAPMDVARELLGRRGPLLHHRGSFLEHVGPQWRDLEDAAVTSWLYAQLEHAKYLHDGAKGPELRRWNPTTAKISQVRDAAAAVTHLPEHVDPPTWIGPGRAPWSWPVVACANGVLEVSGRTLHPATPNLLNIASVPFSYDPQAPRPERWLAFLSTLWPDDPEAIEALQQWLGYVVSGRAELHKILLLVGPPRSGKGTIAGVLEALVGDGNTAHPTLASLGTNFGLSPLIGKPLAVVGDARLSGKTDGSPIVERLLSISGGDRQTVDRKFRDSWTGHLPTRFVILSNELPRLGDASGAIANRFITLTLGTSWLGREDTTLGPALRAELPGILNWALDGLDRLTDRGAFVEPQSSADAVAALHELVSPISAFLRDCCEPGGQVAVADVWAAWQRWSVENGHPTGSVHTLGRNLRAALPALRTAQPRDAGGRQVRTFVGLRLQPAAVPAWAQPHPGPVMPR